MTERAAVRGLGGGRRGARFVAVIAIGALAMTALSACRTDAGAAAFVGNTRISRSQVDQAAAEGVAGKNSTGTSLTKSEAETLVVQSLVFTQVAERFAKEKGYKTPPVPAALTNAVVQNFGTPATSAFTKDFARAYAWKTGLVSDSPSITPTDAEVMAIYQRAVDQHFAAPNQYATVKPEILQVNGLGQTISLERSLSAAIGRYNVSINPRYDAACTSAPCDAVYYPILSLQDSQSGSTFDAVVLPLDVSATDPAVLNSPAPSAPASAG